MDVLLTTGDDAHREHWVSMLESMQVTIEKEQKSGKRFFPKLKARGSPQWDFWTFLLSRCRVTSTPSPCLRAASKTSKVNYFLLLSEQIVPLLGTKQEQVAQSLILPICEPCDTHHSPAFILLTMQQRLTRRYMLPCRNHLGRCRYLEDDSNLQVFESAHSTMLALLSLPTSAAKRGFRMSPDAHRSALKERVILEYADCLVRVSRIILTPAKYLFASLWIADNDDDDCPSFFLSLFSFSYAFHLSRTPKAISCPFPNSNTRFRSLCSSRPKRCRLL